jgi:biotin carboxylase
LAAAAPRRHRKPRAAAQTVPSYPGVEPKLLFLGASISQVPSMRYAREAGFGVVAVDADPDAVGFEFADVAEQVDFSDVAGVTDVGARHGVSGVLAISSDRAVAPAAHVAHALGLPGIGIEVARAMTNKAVMRRRLDSSAVRQPTYRVLTRETDLRRAAEGLAFPAVLKPADSGGQRGLFRIEELGEIAEHLPEVLLLSRSGEAILEEFMPGIELNGLVVVRGGEPTLLTLSDRLRPEGPAFGVGWIHLFPSSLDEAALESACETAFAAVRCLGLSDGIAFPQLIVGEDGSARLVEIAARIPAGQMADLALYATGLNLFDIAIAQALGRPVSDEMVTPRSVRPIAIRFLTASPGVLPVGTVTAIDGLDALRAAPGVLAADVYFGIGDRIDTLRVDFDRRGYIVATADSAAAALGRADAAAERLVVRTEDDVRAHSEVGEVAIFRVGRLAVVAAAIALLVVAVAAALDARTARPAPMVSGISFDWRSSSTCDCSLGVGHLSFRLLHGTRVFVRVLNSVGQPVTTLVRKGRLETGWKHLSWDGRTAAGSFAPNGAYRAEIAFGSPSRTILTRAVELERSPPVYPVR